LNGLSVAGGGGTCGTGNNFMLPDCGFGLVGFGGATTDCLTSCAGHTDFMLYNMMLNVAAVAPSTSVHPSTVRQSIGAALVTVVSATVEGGVYSTVR